MRFACFQSSLARPPSLPHALTRSAMCGGRVTCCCRERERHREGEREREEAVKITESMNSEEQISEQIRARADGRAGAALKYSWVRNVQPHVLLSSGPDSNPGSEKRSWFRLRTGSREQSLICFRARSKRRWRRARPPEMETCVCDRPADGIGRGTLPVSKPHQEASGERKKGGGDDPEPAPASATPRSLQRSQAGELHQTQRLAFPLWPASCHMTFAFHSAGLSRRGGGGGGGVACTDVLLSPQRTRSSPEQARFSPTSCLSAVHLRVM